MDLKPVPDNFCWRPFTNLYVDKWGHQGPCCGYSKFEKFNESGLKTLDYHNDIRQSIQNGKLPFECAVKCTNLEEKGILNTDRISYDGPTDERLIKENIFQLKQLELAVDNVCNLACVTCGSYHSSKWVSENKRMKIVDYDEIKYLNIEPFKDVNVWENVERLILWGGEPFYSKNVLDLLTWLTSNNIGKNIELNFYTNGTIIPDNITQIVNNFKKIQYSVSLDGTHDRFEILRWPAKWKNIEANFKKIKDYKFDNVNLSITYTFSMLNAYYTAEDFEYFSNNFTQSIYRNMLTLPDYWMARHLPDNLKEKIIKKYQKDNYLKYFISELEAERSEEKYQEAIKKLKLLDTHRNTDYRILFDEC